MTRSFAVGAADPTLDQRLSDELGRFNTSAVPGPGAVELTVGCMGLGSQLIAEFERMAATRGARRVFVTSFTFQAPGFDERQGYREILRWDGVPTEGRADVHFRKDL